LAVTDSYKADLGRLFCGWDMTLKLHWESREKRWSVESYAGHLIKRTMANLLGVNLIVGF
jgi:hypothetical protein